MSDYLVRENGTGVYLVSKWDGGKEPVAVYEVQTRRVGYVCNCPSPSPFCKHMSFVEKYQRSPSKRPLFYR